MHKITVTPLPAQPKDEPIEVGSFWQREGNTYVVTRVYRDTEIHLFNLTHNSPLVWGLSTLRAALTRLRNVRIEIEVE